MSAAAGACLIRRVHGKLWYLGRDDEIGEMNRDRDRGGTIDLRVVFQK